ncbi:MAG: hypothetical protein NT149_00920 [Candidatus Gottesmanbacteria bacterium]|nr:hypothetical protein [Candidatus Gottesmanbacteria bacterium]
MDDVNPTPEVLYGLSATPTAPPIPIEETPEIPMDTPLEPQSQIPPPPPMPNVFRGSGVSIFIVLILIVAGLLLFNYIRPFFTGGNKVTTGVTPTPAHATPTPVDPFVGWSEQTIAGISYKLPPDVLAPACDGTGCVSQWTNLPGGTRLTISPKTVTQPLTSLRGVVITDVSGTAFTSQDATISGHTAVEFTGSFSGRTTGGSGFTQMHGFMIEVTPALTLEVNHFTPTGVTADWARDDTLFTQIISTLSFAPVPPIATTTSVPATSSGY